MASPAAKKSRFSPNPVQLPSQPLPPAAALGSPPPGSSGTSDQVQSAVLRYIQKRRYAPSMTEAYQRLRTSTTIQPLDQYALRECLRSEASSVASLALSAPPQVDPLLIEQQYNKFKIWISESLDSFKPELAQLLYPMFTHLYLDLVLAGHKLIAQKFHRRHQSTFLINPNFANFIRILSNILTMDDIQREDSVKTFLNTKYSVTLSNKTFHYLMRYLQQQQHGIQPPILLYILHAKVDVRLADALGAPSSKFEAVQRILHDEQHTNGTSSLSIKKEVTTAMESNNGVTMIKTEPLENGFVQQQQNNNSMSKVLEIVKNVREGPASLPSTVLYRVSNSYSNIICGCMSPKTLVTGCENASILTWDLIPPKNNLTSTEVTEADPSVIKLGCDDILDLTRTKSVLRGHNGPVYDVAFLGPKYLMSVSEDTSMRLWDVETGLNKAIYQGHTYPVWSVDTDRVGVNVVTGSMDKTAKLWHVEHTHPLRVYAGHEQDVDVVQFHPNCNYVATGSSDKTIRLWSHSDANMVRVFIGHKGSIMALAFSPDGKYLASAGEDRRVKIWDLASSALLKDLRGHNDIVQCLTWSRDSNLLVSGGLDGLVKLWDVQSCDILEKSTETYSIAPCTNILDLSYSLHNTLLATAFVSQQSNKTKSS